MNQQEYSYFIHPYNATFDNERSVEVSLIQHELEKYKNKKVLEIGNVLSHYMPTNHVVVDKYEKAPGVINEDALLYKSRNKFDLIVAISTFEHIGLDEAVKDSKKVIKVLKHLLTLLKKDGKIVFTVPISYNANLDNQIHNNELLVTKSFFLVRNSKLNTWNETDASEALKKKYNHPYPNANSIMIGVITKQ